MLHLMRPMLRNCIQRSGFLRFATKTPCSPSAKGAPKKPNLAFEKVKKLQKHFQKDDGKPIFLKGGSRDLLLYRITWGLCFLGLLLQIHLFAMYIIF